MAGKGFFGSLCAGTFGLGVWQTQRYFEKIDLVAEREQALVQPPLSQSDFLHSTTRTTTKTSNQSAAFRRIRFHGRFRYDKECLVGPRGPPPGALPNKPGYAAGGMSRAPLGYFVLTPLELLDKETKPETEKGGIFRRKVKVSQTQDSDLPFVWVNRGWIPRYLVYDDKQPSPQRQEPQQAPPSASSTAKMAKPLPTKIPPTWDRISGPRTITCVASTPENPKFMVAGHQMDKDPPELFWMDLDTLNQHQQQPQNGTVSNNLVAASNQIMTVVQEEDEDELTNFPLPPPAANVGEFKTSPNVHAGYALTWYGLAAAGLFMTRILILRR